jgi:hypothetical protein
VQQFSTSVPFIRGGLSRGYRCVYLYDGVALAEVKRALRAELTSRASNAVERSRLSSKVSTSPWAVSSGGRRLVGEAHRGVQARGLCRARCRGGQDVAGRCDVDLDWECQYEALSTRSLCNLAARVVCLLNRGGLSADLPAKTCRLHAWVAFGTGVLPTRSTSLTTTDTKVHRRRCIRVVGSGSA